MSLKTSQNNDMKKCRDALYSSVNRTFLTTIEIDFPFHPDIWNQHMINAFYKHCLDDLVLPRINESQCLELIGPSKQVSEAKEKYDLMCLSAQLRELPVHNALGQLSTVPRESLVNESKSYNILVSCCSLDEVFSQRLIERLEEENYLIAVDFSNLNASSIVPRMKKADLVLICFTSNYFINEDCRKACETIKSSGNTFLPIISVKEPSGEENVWVESINVEESFYEVFKTELKFKIKEDLNLTFNKLVVELVGQT